MKPALAAFPVIAAERIAVLRRDIRQREKEIEQLFRDLSAEL